MKRRDGRPKHYAHPRYWIREDDVFLSCWWGLRPDAELARRLGRTVNALEVRAKRRWRQSRKANVLTARAVAKLFGVDPTTPVRSWVARGWLHADRGRFGGGGHANVWVFAAASLRRFVETHYWALDIGRMQPDHWLTGVAQQAQAADPWLTVPEAARQVGYNAGILGKHIRRGYLAARRRPCYGTTGGNPAGCLVVRQADLPVYLARVAAEAHAHRSRAARRRCHRQALVRLVPASRRRLVHCWDRRTGDVWTEEVHRG